jgi:outer membrane PBP1 activator LpoA protein
MRVFFALLLWLSAAGCLAESIHAYKSVHTDGTVSYSDTRPASAKSVTEVNVYQESAATEEQGKQRMQEMDAATKRLEKQRAAEARREVTDAQRGLTTAQQSKKHATPERIALAEQRVRLARQRLREIETAGF